MITVLDIETIRQPHDIIWPKIKERTEKPDLDNFEVPDSYCDNGIKKEKWITKEKEKRISAYSKKCIEKYSKAALDPFYAEIAIIGTLNDGHVNQYINYDNEKTLLLDFWDWMELGGANQKFVTLYGNKFDWPMLFRRSSLHGITMPIDKIFGWKGKYFSDRFIDIFEWWNVGGRKDYVSLNIFAEEMGLDKKLGNDEDFSDIWNRDHDEALEYNRRDLEITWEVAKRVGIQ